MASGKTTAGKRIAEKLNLQFVDVDKFIENKYRKTVSEIFKDLSESAFRNIEKEALKEISTIQNVVVATGGGLPCFFDNMDAMNAAGLTVYLKVSAAELAERLLADNMKRPLIEGKTLAEVKDYVIRSLPARIPFYEKATVVADCENIFKKGHFERKITEIINLLPLKNL
jgi:shikimate kinase